MCSQVEKALAEQPAAWATWLEALLDVQLLQGRDTAAARAVCVARMAHVLGQQHLPLLLELEQLCLGTRSTLLEHLNAQMSSCTADNAAAAGSSAGDAAMGDAAEWIKWWKRARIVGEESACGASDEKDSSQEQKGKHRPTPTEVTMAPSFSGPHADKYLAEYTRSCSKGYSSLEEAQAACLKDGTAGGITFEAEGGKYTLRKGVALQPSPSGEISWVKGQQGPLPGPAAPPMQAPAQAPMAGGAAPPYRQLKVEDALAYLDQVKMTFEDKPEIYNQFLDLMKEFKAQYQKEQKSINDVYEEVSRLFKDHTELLAEFSQFLRDGFLPGGFGGGGFGGGGSGTGQPPFQVETEHDATTHGGATKFSYYSITKMAAYQVWAERTRHFTRAQNHALNPSPNQTPTPSPC